MSSKLISSLQASKLGRYVAAGSWCEIVHKEKVDIQDLKDLEKQPTTEFFLADIALVNLSNTIYGSGRFLLPSEIPTQAISTYRAVYNEATEWFEVSVRGILPIYHTKQELEVSNGIPLKLNVMEQSFLIHAEAKFSNNTTNTSSVEGLFHSGSQDILSNTETSTCFVAPNPSGIAATNLPIVALSTVSVALANDMKAIVTSSSALEASSNPTFAYYQSATGCDWASMLDEEDEEVSDAPAYYHSPSGEDWVILDEEAQSVKEYTAKTSSAVLLAASNFDTIDGFQPSVSIAEELDIFIRPASIVSVTKNNMRPAVAIVGEINAALPNLRQYVPEDTTAAFEDNLAQLDPKYHQTIAGRQYAQGVVDWQWMCAASEQLLASGQGLRTRLEAADRSVGWFWVEDHENRESTVSYRLASEVRTPIVPSQDFRPLKPIHHINFAGQPVHQRTYTSPAVSFWAAMSEGLENRVDHNGSLLRSVASSNAGKMLDPFIGPNIVPKLKASKLKEWVTGAVDIVYQTYGTWIDDELQLDDDRRIADGPCSFAGCEDVNHPPSPYVVDPTDGDIVVNDDGRPHPGQVSKKKKCVGLGSTLCLVMDISDGQAEDDTPLSACIEDCYTVPPEASAALLIGTSVEASVNMPTSVLETVIKEEMQYQNRALSVSEEAELTTTQMSDRLLALFSELEEAVDIVLCEVEPLSDEDDDISLSTILEQTEEGPRNADTIFAPIDPQDILAFVRDLDSEPLMPTTTQTLVIRSKDAFADRAPDSVKPEHTLLQQSSAIVFTGPGRLRPSITQTMVFDAVIQQESEVVSKLQPNYLYASPEVVWITGFSRDNTLHRELAVKPFVLLELHQATQDDSKLSLCFTAEKKVLGTSTIFYSEDEPSDIFGATSSAIDGHTPKVVNERSLPIEEQVIFTSKTDVENAIIVMEAYVITNNEKQAIAPNAESQLSGWVEEDWTSSEPYIDGEYDKSSNGSLTDSDHDRSCSSFSDTPSTGSRFSSGTKDRVDSNYFSSDQAPSRVLLSGLSRSHITRQGIGAGESLEADNTVTQAVFNTVRNQDERMAMLPVPVPYLRQSVRNRPLVGMNPYDEDRDFDYQSDDELEARESGVEDSWSSDSEAGSDDEVHLHESYRDNFINHDPITTIFSPMKISVEPPACSEESSSHNGEFCSRTNVVNEASTMGEAAQEEPFKTDSTSELTLTQPQSNQKEADLGKQSSFMIRTEESLPETNLSDLSAKELVENVEERGGTEAVADYLHVLKDAPEDREASTPAVPAEGQAFAWNITSTVLEETVQEEAFAPTAFDCDVGFSSQIPKLSDCLLYGSIAGYLGYRLFTAFRR
ncbi:hypothetical protein MMC18_009673 [Xylographa bjoerkii]|nr:hypothetical protein [Xylographa bjoerkii]